MKLYFIFTRRGLAVILALTVLALVIIGRFSSLNHSYADGSTHRERMEFLAYYKIEVDESAVLVKETRLPQKVSGFFDDYNQIIVKGGFDSSDFCGKDITVYSYKSKASPEKTINLIVNGGKIIAGNITDNLNCKITPLLKEK